MMIFFKCKPRNICLLDPTYVTILLFHTQLTALFTSAYFGFQKTASLQSAKVILAGSVLLQLSFNGTVQI